MELTVWTYEGPPHIGAMRIAASMEAVHLVLHAPLGDSYADLLFTMIARSAGRPPVSYTGFQARDLGGDTAQLVKTRLAETVERFKPQALLVGEACTAELLQDQPGALAEGMGFDIPVISLELPAFTRKEAWGASETFHQLVRSLLNGRPVPQGAGDPSARAKAEGRRPRANLLGPTALGFRCRDDVIEVTKLLDTLGVDVHLVAPAGATPADLARIPEADFNICLYPEIAHSTCVWLERMFKQPRVRTVPIGVGATRDFVFEVARLAGLDPAPALAQARTRLPWFSRSVDSTYLTGKRVFIFGDATHVMAAARMAREELGFDVVGLGTYSREFARELRALAEDIGVEALITDDYLAVEARVAELHPELVLGTQMERHIAKRLGIPCAVISSPVHVQDFPARYAPQMGFEGANVIFDTWVHPLMMGLEEHLITMFREDVEFNDGEVAAPARAVQSAEVGEPDAAAPGAAAAAKAPGPNDSAPGDPAPSDPAPSDPTPSDPTALRWEPDAEKELRKIPFFVRGKARRNTENFARERGLTEISIDTLYEAKAHFGR
ncbi:MULTISPECIES: ferredoxin:protochlorophyllide reductase (ATP-dependent) subunit B [Thiorhodovibrio]|uniref:ferredoxin:protochlorophyllide reductase (ATP-dependent) subunit B n=1 Tax=Thiorhodovibrio TaxID=61593 RepID=UPI0019121CB1|nr:MULTISPECIES: ferredoxin:protochlorophyllide reductase (ATP-dependent) subunit B [Thiorhodovibrio]MBK5970703.1 ferredoxin:protochlorophyllide reductase (ATP-dependent) subunit B [Thiorhodovibrio winogradskyi]WPL14248.1 ferredoxin:protochlorophyllide reductase (ATP-dependent), subunit B [Thiorhodovibrio litoralis]